MQALEEELEALKARYEQYFLGIERREPVRWREELKRNVARVKGAFTRNAGLRFRIQTLHARYLSYERLWLRERARARGGDLQARPLQGAAPRARRRGARARGGRGRAGGGGGAGARARRAARDRCRRATPPRARRRRPSPAGVGEAQLREAVRRVRRREEALQRGRLAAHLRGGREEHREAGAGAHDALQGEVRRLQGRGEGRARRAEGDPEGVGEGRRAQPSAPLRSRRAAASARGEPVEPRAGSPAIVAGATIARAGIGRRRVRRARTSPAAFGGALHLGRPGRHGPSGFSAGAERG